MATLEKEQWFVATKMLLRDGDKLLLIKDIFDDGWDIPGGRIKKDEFETPLLDVAARKMKEELGEKIKYEINPNVKVYFRHERLEQPENNKVRIFALGFEAKYLGGEIETGEYIDRYEWVDVNNFNPKDYLRGGWLKGVEEYLKL